MSIGQAWRKTEIAILFALTLGVSIFIWWSTSGVLLLNGGLPIMLRSISNLLAVLAVFFILLQLMLIGRVKWIEQVFGLDKLARVHHAVGFSVIFFIVGHPLLLIASSSLLTHRSWYVTFWNFVNYMEDVGSATVAVGLFLVLIILAILIVLKKLKYEAWYLTHLAMYAAVLLAFGHQLNLGDDFGAMWTIVFWYFLYVFVFANVLYYRFFSPVWNTWQHKFIVDKVVHENDDTVSIYISGRDLDKYKIKAGQFFFFRFLDRSRWWQAHPFSLSCLPNEKFLRITVKNLGDYTSELAKVKPGTRVYIDGPHGVFIADKMNTDKCLLIAGGVGITPVRSLVEDLLQRGKDVILFYGNQTKKSLIFGQELADLVRNSRLEVKYVLSAEPEWQGEKGFIDHEKIQRLVPDYMERDIYVCGPKMMTKMILPAIKSLHVHKSRIHFEKFSL